MNIPAEFIGRVLKTKFRRSNLDYGKVNQIQEEFPGSEIDVIYENLTPIVVLVFESTEDCLVFTLKYGKDYV